MPKNRAIGSASVNKREDIHENPGEGAECRLKDPDFNKQQLLARPRSAFDASWRVSESLSFSVWAGRGLRYPGLAVDDQGRARLDVHRPGKMNVAADVQPRDDDELRGKRTAPSMKVSTIPTFSPLRLTSPVWLFDLGGASVCLLFLRSERCFGRIKAQFCLISIFLPCFCPTAGAKPGFSPIQPRAALGLAHPLRQNPVWVLKSAGRPPYLEFFFLFSGLC